MSLSACQSLDRRRANDKSASSLIAVQPSLPPRFSNVPTPHRRIPEHCFQFASLIISVSHRMPDHETFCERCGSLSFEQMSTPEGQAYHENWAALEASAACGCQLCDFFLKGKADCAYTGPPYLDARSGITVCVLWGVQLQMWVRDDSWNGWWKHYVYHLHLVNGTHYHLLLLEIDG